MVSVTSFAYSALIALSFTTLCQAASTKKKQKKVAFLNFQVFRNDFITAPDADVNLTWTTRIPITIY